MINLNQNRGFALIFTLLIFLLTVSFTAVFIMAVASSFAQTNRLANEKKAYYVADAGLVDAYERITQAGINVVASSTCVNANVPSTCSVPYIPSASTDNGKYTVGGTIANYVVSVVYSNNPRSNYTITSTGTYGGISRTLQLKIMGASISKYAYWSQSEINPALGGALWWVGMPGFTMLTDGPVQTNGQLNIFGNPIFESPVTEANMSINGSGALYGPTSSTPNYYYGTASNPNGNGSDPAYIFQQGITNQAPAFDLPPTQTLSAIQTTANNGSGLVLTGSSQIVFNANGTLTVTGNVVNSNCVTTTTYKNTSIAAPANGVVYVQSTKTIPACKSSASDGNATVQGTVNGQYTVAADQNVYLSGSVTYNNDPRKNPSSTDMVGLVANQNITVIEADAPTKLEVDGVLEALQGSFQVDQYWVYRGNASTAVMDQFGSLINYACGATGEMDLNGNLLGGWNQIQSYDTRLANTAPPGFPPYVNNSGNGVYTKTSIAEL